MLFQIAFHTSPSFAVKCPTKAFARSPATKPKSSSQPSSLPIAQMIELTIKTTTTKIAWPIIVESIQLSAAARLSATDSQMEGSQSSRSIRNHEKGGLPPRKAQREPPGGGIDVPLRLVPNKAQYINA